MDRIGRRATCLLAVSLVVIAVGVGTGGLAGVEGASDGPSSGTGGPVPLTQASGPGPIPQVDIDADVILMKAAVDPGGAAEWRITYRLELRDDPDTEAFRQLQADVESNRSAYIGPFEQRMSRTIEAARAATGREMQAHNYSVTAERDSQPQAEFGVVTFRLEWDGFASASEETIRVGDAIDALFLNDGESLELRWPTEFSPQSSTPSPTTTTDSRAVWQGPVDFDTGEPRIVLTTSEAQAGGNGAGGGPPMLPLAGAAGLVLVATAVALFVRRDSEDTEDAPAPTAAEAEPKNTGPPPELLSNEEQVLGLLDQNGGRIRQKTVAEQLDWTAAKTSQVVGTLRDDDKVEAFRLGRENVLTLPDVDIESTADGGTDDGDR